MTDDTFFPFSEQTSAIWPFYKAVNCESSKQPGCLQMFCENDGRRYRAHMLQDLSTLGFSYFSNFCLLCPPSSCLWPKNRPRYTMLKDVSVPKSIWRREETPGRALIEGAQVYIWGTHQCIKEVWLTSGTHKKWPEENLKQLVLFIHIFVTIFFRMMELSVRHRFRVCD